MKIRSCVSVGGVLACASFVLAQGSGGVHNNQHLRFTQEHGITFSTIGDVGNPAATVPNWHPPISSTRQAGSVSYEYRIATTEVTWGQYYEFVQAHARTVPVNIRDGIVSRDSLRNYSGGAGSDPSPITYLGPGPSGEGLYAFDDSRANEPATSTWRYFARFVNWLHNGKPDVEHALASDFEGGVYDVSTFVRIPDGPFGVSYFTDQDRRSPGARFWIPSGDELIKATFYDPNKDGEGSPGYWVYGHSSDTAPIPGDPAQGGQTNAGTEKEWPNGQTRPLDVGSYPDVQSPWGLLDTVGGGAEWTEEWNHFIEELQQLRFVLAGKAFSPLELSELGYRGYGSPVEYFSLRLAAAVPSSGVTIVFILAGIASGVRRRP